MEEKFNKIQDFVYEMKLQFLECGLVSNEFKEHKIDEIELEYYDNLIDVTLDILNNFEIITTELNKAFTIISDYINNK